MYTVTNISLIRVANAWLVQAEFRTGKEYAGTREWAETTTMAASDRVFWIMNSEWENLDFPLTGPTPFPKTDSSDNPNDTPSA